MPGSTDSMNEPIEVEEGEWAEALVEVANGNISITISDTHELILTPQMALRLSRKLRLLAAKCAPSEGGN